MKIEEYFPYEKPRMGQIKAIKTIKEKIESEYEYIILDAKTGFGKTAIARTLTDYYAHTQNKKSFIITNTIQLQNQYLEDAKKHNKYNIKYKISKGKENFQCRNSTKPCMKVNKNQDIEYNEYKFKFIKTNKKIENCRKGECILGLKCGYYYLTKHNKNNNIPKKYLCQYYNSKQETENAEIALLNYDMNIINNKYKSKINFTKRPLAIYDEAHKIEDKILNHVELTLNEKTLKKDINYKFTKEQLEQIFPEDWNNDLNIIIEKYQEKIEQLKIKEEITENKEKRKEILKEKLELEHHQNKIQYTLNLLNIDYNNWCISQPLENLNTKTIHFKPIYINHYAKELLFKSANTHILQSGSFIDIERFLEELNINLEDAAIYQTENIFNFQENSPLIIDLVGKMTKQYKNKTKPLTIPKLKEIFQRHKKEKGLIHCKNKELAKYIINEFKNTEYEKRLTTYGINENNLNKNDAIQEFKKSKTPLIMVSYSMEEGVDLKYDECRFQIFYKTPFPYLGDERINRRRNIDPDWYLVKAIENFQQMYGRGIRAKDDYCINYVLDSSFTSLYYHPKFPEYIRESIIENPKYSENWISTDGQI